ncbi:MAG: CRISPR-associated protein Cse1 [Rhodobacteraceae bacterium]|nr:CRISPR-associated protein Cse1 [Paracoccaceae bacterium]
MFLVQLGALALTGGAIDTPPPEEAAWRELLLRLTSGDATAWALTAAEDRAAFLQPAVTAGLKWSPVETPDALDMIITSKNHDLKQTVARRATPQDWLFALVSLQTMEGYGGAGNQGIARMNGGSSSRPMLGFAPVRADGSGPDVSAWWRRDLQRLLQLRQAGKGLSLGTAGGPALLWTLPWPEGGKLRLHELDPWFIESCRRIRLVLDGDRLSALRSTSKEARIDAKDAKGVTDDPWTPVKMDDPPKSLTLGTDGDFTYERLSNLLFEADGWVRPTLAHPGEGEAAGVIVAEAISRGNAKTEGFKSRIVPVPGWARRLFGREDLGHMAGDQIAEIEIFDKALRNGLALVAAGGDRDKLGKDHYARAGEARRQFDRAADRLFFEALWKRAAATGDDRQDAEHAFLTDLFHAARTAFDLALPAIPCASILRPRAEARGRRAFGATIRRGHGKGGDRRFDFLFPSPERQNDEVA